MEPSPETLWSRPTKYVVGVGLVLFGIFIIYISSSVIPLLVVAGLIAFTVRPIVEFLHNWLEDLKSWEAPLGPLDDYIDGVADAILNALNGASQAVQPQTPPLRDLAAQLGSALTVTFGAVAGLVGGIFSSAILFIFVFLSSIYLSLSAARYRDAIVQALPEVYRPEIIESPQAASC